jgi:hypothetical protein
VRTLSMRPKIACVCSSMNPTWPSDPPRYAKCRKDGSDVVYGHYKCAGQDGISKCRNLIRIADADEQVESGFLAIYGPMELVKLQVVPGSSHELEIEDIKTRIDLTYERVISSALDELSHT